MVDEKKPDLGEKKLNPADSLLERYTWPDLTGEPALSKKLEGMSREQILGVIRDEISARGDVSVPVMKEITTDGVGK